MRRDSEVPVDAGVVGRGDDQAWATCGTDSCRGERSAHVCVHKRGFCGSVNAHADGRRAPPPRTLISLCAFFVVTDGQIQTWADEAEAG